MFLGFDLRDDSSPESPPLRLELLLVSEVSSELSREDSGVTCLIRWLSPEKRSFLRICFRLPDDLPFMWRDTLDLAELAELSEEQRFRVDFDTRISGLLSLRHVINKYFHVTNKPFCGTQLVHGPIKVESNGKFSHKICATFVEFFHKWLLQR